MKDRPPPEGVEEIPGMIYAGTVGKFEVHVEALRQAPSFANGSPGAHGSRRVPSVRARLPTRGKKGRALPALFGGQCVGEERSAATSRRTKGQPMIAAFEGSTRDLERLDALCLECWSAVTRVGNPIGMTRVRSAGRMHVWPGDPDEIAALLMARGFRCRFAQPREVLWRDEPLTHAETTVLVLGVGT
jgi:hypothetical protein